MPGFVTVLVSFMVLAAPPPVRAQIPYLDPLPWIAARELDPGNALQISLDRIWDGTTGWSVNRVGLEGFIATGSRGFAFLRLRYESFDSDGFRTFERWPDVREDPDDTSLDDWPFEDRVAGLFRPEVGVLTLFSLPLLGRLHLGLAAALPIGRDELYPFGSVSVPLRGDVRKRLALGDRLRMGLIIGGLVHMDSSGDVLASSAFPGGWHGAGDLVYEFATRRTLVLTYDHGEYEGRISDRIGAELWWPWGSFDSLGFTFARELTGTENRAAQTFAGIVLRLKTRVPEEDTAAETRQVPTIRER